MTGAGGKGRRAKADAGVTSDEESGPEGEARAEEPEGQVEEQVPPSRLRPRPRPKPKPKAPARPQTPPERGQSDVEMDAGAETPKTGPRVEEEEVLETPQAGPSTARVSMEPRSLKRRREDEDEDEGEVESETEADGSVGPGTVPEAGAEDEQGSLDEVAPTEDASTAQTSPTNEFLIRRKRARH